MLKRKPSVCRTSLHFSKLITVVQFFFFAWYRFFNSFNSIAIWNLRRWRPGSSALRMLRCLTAVSCSKRSCSTPELRNDSPQTGRAKVGAKDCGNACKKGASDCHNDWQVTNSGAKYFLLVVAWQRQWWKNWKVLNRVSKLSESCLRFYIEEGKRTVNAPSL